jgi:hypothetical protein
MAAVIAYNRLSDIGVAVTSGGSPTTSISSGATGTAYTVNIDSLEITDTVETVNNKGGQDFVAVNRPTGGDWTAKCTAAFGPGVSIPTRGLLCKIQVTGGGGETCDGICTEANVNYSDNSKTDFTVKAYGKPITRS